MRIALKRDSLILLKFSNLYFAPTRIFRILVMIQNSENPVSLPAWIYGADLETPDSDILWDMTYDLVLT